MNPLRPDLIECLDKAGIEHVSIEYLKNKAYEPARTPEKLEWENNAF